MSTVRYWASGVSSCSVYLPVILNFGVLVVGGCTACIVCG